METNTTLKMSDRPTTPEQVADMKDVPYREAIGSLMYLMVGTRPDLAQLVQETSRHLSNPGRPHWNALLRGLRYLKSTKSHGIVLGGRHAASMIHDGKFLSAYCDADFANSDDARSVTGYISMLFGTSPISWRSQLQTLTTVSSTEAEYVSMASNIQEMKYLKTLVEELHYPHPCPMTINEDNQSTMKIVRTLLVTVARSISASSTSSSKSPTSAKKSTSFTVQHPR